MKQVWKPLNVGKLRLYKVKVTFLKHPNWNETHIIAAKSPTNAEDIYKKIIKDANWIEEPFIKGYALNVFQPEDWWENGVPCLNCEPERWDKV